MSLSGATIAFDLDGTLVETAPDLMGALNVVLGERGLPMLPVGSARALVGQGARIMLERGFAAAGQSLAPEEVGGLVTRFIEVYRGRIASESTPFPNLLPALDELTAAGATLVVCTNKRTDLSTALLDALGLTSRFAAVVGGDAVPASKPDPGHYLAAIAAAGGDPRRSLMVGDSINDVASAQAAGAPVVVVSFGYTDIPAAELGAEALIDDFAQLPAVARRLLCALPGAPTSAIGTPSPADA